MSPRWLRTRGGGGGGASGEKVHGVDDQQYKEVKK